MRIQLETGGQANLIRTYAVGQIIVNQDSYTRSLVVLPVQVIADWPPQAFAELAVAHFAALVSLRPELLILGTGRRQRFPHAELLAPLVGAGIGWEIMDTGAACRTYNILMGEGRNVAAALLMIEG
ncbi:MAG: Mth938-like domain-containing protein [Pseudomonadota bacterium]